MSDTPLDTDESITTTENGLTAEKTIATGEEDLTKVCFTITSHEVAPRRVRLVETVPAEMNGTDVGFHPDYDPDNWEVVDARTLAFTATLDPGETVETIYGVNSIDVNVQQALLDPDSLSIEVLDAPSPDERSEAAPLPIHDGGEEVQDERVEGSDDQFISQSPQESPSSLERIPRFDSDESDGRVSSERSSIAPSLSDVAAEMKARQSSHSDPTSPTDPVGALVEALEEGSVSDEQLDTLRTHLGGAGSTRSLELRLQDIRGSIADLELYREALEEFIDERGTTPEVIGQFESRIDDLAGSVDELSAKFATLEAHVDELATDVERVESVPSRLDTIEEALETVSGDVTDLREEREDAILSVATPLIDDRVADLEATIDAIQMEATVNARFRERLTAAIDDVPREAMDGSGEEPEDR